MSSVDDIINNALAISNSEKENADAAAQNAITASEGFAFSSPAIFSFTPGALEPAVPQLGNASLSYEAQLAALVAMLSGQLASFFNLYYPLASDAFDQATNWLVDVIANGGTGIPTAIADQIYQRGRDRVVIDGLKAKNAAYSDFAARGFPIPSGALVGSLQEIRLGQLGANAGFARDVMIKQIDVEIETIKFAVGEALKSRQTAMLAAVDYIKAIASAPSNAAQYAALNSEAQARAIGATAELYSARLKRDELILRSMEANAMTRGKAQEVDVTGFYRGVDSRVRAAVGAAQVYGQAAGAALSGLIGIASTADIRFP